MDAYARSVGFSDPGPSQIWSCTPKQIPSLFRQQLKGVVSGGSHILRMSHNRIPRVALRWTRQAKIKHSRPKVTWRITVEKEIKTMGLT